MNPYKFLVWQYSSRSENWYDATEDIEWLEELSNSIFIKYRTKDYPIHVSYRNIAFFTDPENVDFLIIEYRGVTQYGAKKCLLFGNKYKIFFESGYTLVANKSEIEIFKDELKENPTARGILSYYRAVVQKIAKTEEDEFLLSQFESISNLNSESVLSYFFSAVNGPSSCPLRRAIISPFGSNLSQLKAIETAFSNRISVIEGPPGTGKTQTILNIIANAVAKGYKVAVVSNNNSAIDNVYEKLGKNGYGFLCARLGNKDNVDDFFRNLNISLPTFTYEGRTRGERIEFLKNELQNLFEKENEKNKLFEKRDSIVLEHNHFLDEHRDFDFKKFSFKTNRISSKNLMSVLVFLSEWNKEKLSFFKKMKLKRMIKCNKRFFNLDVNDQIILLKNQYFVLKKLDVEKEIDKITKELHNRSFDDYLQEYKTLSTISFKNSIYEMFKDKRNTKYEKDDYKLNFKKFTDDFPVFLSSTYALAQCTKNGFMFDYLIVDESSQVNMASAILSMRVAKNMIVVGDIKQLPQIDDRDFAETNRMLLTQYGVSDKYSYYGHSILSSIFAVFGNSVPRTLLKEHYRCHPEIIGFCNKEFYDDELIVYSKSNSDKKCLSLVKLVEGNHARKNPTGEGGQYSERESDEIFDIVRKNQFEDLGIISPYRAQVKVLQEKIASTEIEISTIHKFQGREKKNIILSTVVNETNDFVDDPNMINVAVSRAIETFTVVVSDKVAKSESGVLADLVNYIEYHADVSEVRESTISSVFDILYADYSSELENYVKKHRSDDFVSELRIKDVLLQTLKREHFGRFKFSMHVSLKDIFRGRYIDMNTDEKKFFFNPWSHADFVIYNKFSNKPLAIIEVDGVGFHEQQSVQQKRDALKDSIIEKTGIKMLRLKTNGSGELQKIIEMLNLI